MKPNAVAVASHLAASQFFDGRASVACPLTPEVREYVSAGFVAVPRIEGVANRLTVDGRRIELEVIEGSGGMLQLMHGLGDLPPDEGGA